MTEVDERDDPEASYRRGYQQGAQAAFEATQRITIEKLRDWIGIKLFKWRYQGDLTDRANIPPTP